MTTRKAILLLGALILANSYAIAGTSDVDVWVTLSNGLEMIPGGETTIYRVRVGNNGPGDANGAQVVVSFDSAIAVGNWTCSSTGTDSCPNDGSGDIDESISLPSGVSAVFTIGTSVPASPEIKQTIEALVTEPLGVSDTDPSNNIVSLTQVIGIFGASFEDPQPQSLFSSIDLDLDGWSPATGDCCEDTGTCPSPFFVNPGAAEIPSNGVNDDCDIASADNALLTCSLSAKFGSVDAIDLANAMDICRSTTADVELENRTWGLISAELVNADGTSPNASGLANIRDSQSAVMTAFGTGGIVPRAGATLAGLSTGTMRDVDDPGYIFPNSGTSFGRNGQPPAIYLAAHGGNLPSSASCLGNCPAGSGANDSVNLRLEIRVPTNALGFSYQFRFLSAEYWSYQCTTFNDYSLSLLTTGAAGIPVDKNIAFDSNGNPLSVNNGFFDVCQPMSCNLCPNGTDDLAGTGFDMQDPRSSGVTGGATVWLQTTAPVVPAEVMQLELMIFDVSDGILDSVLILDGFEWLYDPTAVGTGPPE
jgi:hypothetical protein